jgi:hypothetical protein
MGKRCRVQAVVAWQGGLLGEGCRAPGQQGGGRGTGCGTAGSPTTVMGGSSQGMVGPAQLHTFWQVAGVAAV